MHPDKALREELKVNMKKENCSPEMSEALAIQFAAENQGKRYLWKDAKGKQSIGYFSILEDMNCCAPTDNVLFAFECIEPESGKIISRKVMQADEMLSLAEYCTRL